MLTDVLPDFDDVPRSLQDEVLFDAFLQWTSSRGITLYPAQEEAALNLVSGDHVILSTPTGSGKSMVAIAAHFFAMARGRKTFYTAPIKALVNEKFFALCKVFGAESVGLMTGDATVNAQAPIVCATAEIVANIALREGVRSDIRQVVMDEFHYYSDPTRGWAWQVPLLELPRAQFLLMSATLGDTSKVVHTLETLGQRKVQLVTGTQRPVPLEFHYVYTPVQETIESLIEEHKAPVYVVHFSQREAIERAQSLTTSTLITPEEKRRIADAIGSFRYSSTFGATLSRLLRRGIGVHHAGLLPKYRLLVERLAQEGLLKVICGTDTLGVGINVPIRSVLLTSLAKFDGQKKRILSAREFHQIAGRAGRAGFDSVGYVTIEAPEHEIENWRLRERAGTDPKKLKKLRLKSAREGDVVWGERTYERLLHAEPEPLVSRFHVSHSMLLNVVARPGDAYEHLQHLIRENHSPREAQNAQALEALAMFRGLVNAGHIERLEECDPSGRRYRLVEELPRDFALNQPLAPFAVAALELLDPASPSYTLDVISVIESVLDNPNVVLRAQRQAARSEEYAALKAEGTDVEEIRRILDDVQWPQPLADLLQPALQTYCQAHPWAREFDVNPKSVVRDMLERGMTFSDFIATYGLARAEGEVLRYLTDAWRTLHHTVPMEHRTEEFEEILDWLKALLSQVDSSLMDEWTTMSNPDAPIDQRTLELRETAFGVEDPDALTANQRAFTVMVRNYFFQIVQHFAMEREERLEELTDYLDSPCDFPAAMDQYFDEYADLDVGPAARGPEYFRLDTSGGRRWQVRQVLKDPNDDKAFAFEGEVDLDASDDAGEVRLSSLRFVS